MSTLIRHLGADVDAEALEREIRAEVARKEREGVYGPELLLGIAPDALRDRMEALRGAAELTLDPPVHSTRPGLGPMVAAVKRAVAKLLRWHTRWLVGQVQTLGGSTVAALSEMADRVDEVERRQERVLEQLTRMQAAYLVAHPSYPDATWAAALADVAMLQDLAVRPERGAVACLGCGDGRLVAALASTGAECYGVEPDPGLARAARDRGLDVRAAGLLEHLAAVPAGSLAGVAVESAERLGGAGLDELLRLAAAALVTGGVLVLAIGAQDGSPEDLVGGRVAHLPFELLAESAGFRRVRVERGARVRVFAHR